MSIRDKEIPNKQNKKKTHTEDRVPHLQIINKYYLQILKPLCLEWKAILT